MASAPQPMPPLPLTTARPGRHDARDRPWRVADAGHRSCSRRGVGSRSGARPRAVTGPGSSPVRPRQVAPRSRSSTGSSRSTGPSPSFTKCPCPQLPRARNGQRRWPSSPPPWIPGVCMTGTYPPSPRPLPMSPMHLTDVRDGVAERGDDRARRGQLSAFCPLLSTGQLEWPQQSVGYGRGMRRLLDPTIPGGQAFTNA